MALPHSSPMLCIIPPPICILSQFFTSELVMVVLDYTKDYHHCSYCQKWDFSFHLTGKLSNSTGLCICFLNITKYFVYTVPKADQMIS